MAEPEGLVLELLRAIRIDIDSVKGDAREIKTHMTVVESGIAGLRRDVADLGMSIAGLHVTHDRLVDRIERIERRLDLIDT